MAAVGRADGRLRSAHRHHPRDRGAVAIRPCRLTVPSHRFRRSRRQARPTCRRRRRSAEPAHAVRRHRRESIASLVRVVALEAVRGLEVHVDLVEPVDQSIDGGHVLTGAASARFNSSRRRSYSAASRSLLRGWNSGCGALAGELEWVGGRHRPSMPQSHSAGHPDAHGPERVIRSSGLRAALSRDPRSLFGGMALESRIELEARAGVEPA